MADYEVGNCKPPKHTQIKPGEVRNPLGGRAHNPELRAIKRLTRAEVADIGTLIVGKNVEKLQAIIEDAKTNPNSKHSALKVWMATIAIKGIAKGDAHAMDVLLNRLVGRVAEKIELTGENGGPVRQLVGAMTPEERKEELARLRKMRKDAGED